MKQCEVCQKWADNGDKRCQNCGSPFKYDPRVNPFSETRIFLAILLIAVVGLIVSNAIPQQLPDPTECSRTNVRRFSKIADRYFKKTRNVLRSDMITSRELSKLISYKYEAEDIPVPVCLEPAKTELITYLGDVYYIALFSVWGDFQGATDRTESAGIRWDAFNAHLDGVKACLPNCP